MFLEDELEYVRLKRNDNIMGWLAIVFVAALVFMFAGVMNSASATGSPYAHRTEAAIAAPVSGDVAAIQTDDAQALASSDDNASVAHASTARLADHDIKTGALLLSFALMGGSFVMLTFGGPRSGRREDEDAIDAL